MTTKMNVFNYLAILLTTTVVVHGAANAQTNTDVVINVTNTSGEASRELHCGVNTTATLEGFDSELGEISLPPFPPTESFEARFVSQGGSMLGQGSPADFRPYQSSTQTDQFKIRFQGGTNGLPVKLTWDKDYIATHYKSAIIKDAVIGTIVSADMRQVSSLDVSNGAITELIVETQAPGLVTSVEEPVAGVQFNLQSAPTPTHDAINILYTLPRAATVTLTLTDATGRELSRMIDADRRAAGEYREHFDVSNLPSGTYFATLQVDGVVTTVRSVVTR